MSQREQEIKDILSDSLSRPQYITDVEKPSTPAGLLTLLKKSLFNELNKQISINSSLTQSKYASFDTCIPILYSCRFQKIRTSLLLLTNIKKIIKYSNNDSHEMKHLINYVTKQISVYQQVFAKDDVDISSKIDTFCRKHVKYVIRRIRKQPTKKSVIKKIDQTISTSTELTVFDYESASVIYLTELFLEGCNVSSKYDDRKLNPSLFMKAYNSVKSYIISILEEKVSSKIQEKNTQPKKRRSRIPRSQHENLNDDFC